MNWSRAKSIFLITFLILDLFLGFQLYQKRKSADDYLPPDTQPPQQIMKKYGIKWPENLPNVKSAAYIQGASISFESVNVIGHSDASNGSNGSSSDSNSNGKGNGGNNSSDGSTATSYKKGTTTETKTVQKSLNPDIAAKEVANGKKIQTITAVNDTTISSQLVKPLAINLSSKDQPFQDFLQQYVYNGDQYTLWQNGGPNAPYIFVETFKGRPVFSKGQSTIATTGGPFPPGTLKVNMANGKVISYKQSYLKLQIYKKKKDLVAPLDNAVYTLYSEDDIPNHSTVDFIGLSYYNLIENDLGNVRLFVPTWHILVDTGKSGEKEFFVNAITGGILTPTKQGNTGG